MPSEKEEKYMETHKATINRQDEKASLILNINEDNLEIELTEDKPNEVKSVFNNLIAFLKKGSFQFELEDEKEDLYFHICTEYIGQLNTELSSIYQELEDYELLEESE
jgi:hypothetical protein